MSNIQAFEQAFAVTFPVEMAQMVLDRMSDLYGAAFKKRNKPFNFTLVNIFIPLLKRGFKVTYKLTKHLCLFV